MGDDVFFHGGKPSRADLRLAVENCSRLTYSRSGGPGGQNVNKRNTKVSAHLDLGVLCESLGARSSLLPVLISGLGAGRGGIVVARSGTFRYRELNRKEVLDRLTARVWDCLEVPGVRVPSRRSRSSREKRLRLKKQRGDLKRSRVMTGFEGE